MRRGGAVQCTLGFDLYDTLFDTKGLARALQPVCAERGLQTDEVIRMWRDKQLEYSFRRGLMQRFKDFSVCTRDALQYCDAYFKLHLSAQQQAILLAALEQLPPFADVEDALTRLSETHRIFAVSNACVDSIESLLTNAKLRHLFVGVVSVSETKTFKPDPAVYTHFLRQTQSDPEKTWLVSAHAFDIIGADSVGMRTAWVKRSTAHHFDPWGVHPELTVTELGQLVPRLRA